MSSMLTKDAQQTEVDLGWFVDWQVGC